MNEISNKHMKGSDFNERIFSPEHNLSSDMIDGRVPYYYKGENGYEARKVVANFNLTYNIGTAVTYLLRAYRKHDTPVDCIKKAIAHLEFELEKIKS